MKTAVLIAVMALVTLALRAFPFIVFQKRVPRYVSYLGRVLPPAIIGMLVVYCLKDTPLAAPPHGIPELLAGASVVVLQAWKRHFLLSIISGTALYMLLVQGMMQP
ncbi:MAG: branched-chain amino acid transporter permease [Desulfovibrio sp.]|jgi:branched-subunit amino acid transport protein AzlD|nr:AzlD domain-containing protein [Mailhella sp.]